MNKKRLLIFVLLVALVMALAACSPDYKWGPLDTGAADNSPLVSNGGSVVAYKGYPLQSAYAASKHALAGFTKSLASEVYREDIRVHLISPGGVFTDMVRIARPDLTGEDMILPEDIAEIAAFFIEHRTNAVIDEICVHRSGKEPFL